jgi:hypothetical protein
MVTENKILISSCSCVCALGLVKKAGVSILYHLRFFCYIFRVQIPIIQELLFFYKTSKTTLGPTQLPIQWLPEFFPTVKLPGHEINHSLLSHAKVGNGWSYRPTSTHTNAFIVPTEKTLPFNTATLISKNDISSKSHTYQCYTHPFF